MEDDIRIRDWIDADPSSLNPMERKKFASWVVKTLTTDRSIKLDSKDGDFIKALAKHDEEKQLTENQIPFIIGNDAEYKTPRGFPAIIQRYHEALRKLIPEELDPEEQKAQDMAEAAQIEERLSVMFKDFKGGMKKFLSGDEVQALRRRYLELTRPESVASLTDDELEDIVA